MQKSKTRRAVLNALGTTVMGAVSIAVAVAGFVWWHDSAFFHFSKIVGDYFTTSSFIGLMLFTVFLSGGVTLLYAGVSAFMRLIRNALGLVAFGALGTMFLAVGCLGLVWGSETMQCFGIFCLDTSKYVFVKGLRAESSIAFLSMIGLSAFFSLVPIGLAMLTQVALKATKLDQRWMQSSKQELSIRGTFAVVYTAAAFITLSSFALVTFFFPNSWSSFTPGRIAIRARQQVTDNYTLCATERNEYTCPELPSSWVFTRKWVWSDSLVLKMYPSNIFFFSYLLIILLTVTAIRASRKGRVLLKRRCPGVLRDFTYGEAAFAVLTVLMLSLFFAYWVNGHNFKSRFNGVTDGTTRTDKWARALGQLAVALMSLCLFPASRYSVLHSILGTSWEASLWVHKVLGYGMLLATFAHMVAWYVRYGELNVFPQAVLAIPPVSPPGHRDNFTIPHASLIAWFMFVAMGVFALEPVRRRFFELFYYMHIAAFYMIVPCVLWHAAASWEYLLPGLTVWFVDRVIRMYRSASSVEIVSATASGPIVELQFRHATLSAAPGQYAFVNIPELSLLQWHPFSLSISREGCYTFHIKSMGDDTWTGRLVQLVKERGGDFAMSVDGPCGRVQNFSDYKAIVLVAGGIGITPCASIYSYFRSQRAVSGTGPYVTLLWTLRDVELLSMMPNLWQDVGDVDMQLMTEPVDTDMPHRIFVTGKKPMDDMSNVISAEVLYGRPNLQSEIVKGMEGLKPCNVLIFACGSASFMKSVRDIALAAGVNYHGEVFHL